MIDRTNTRHKLFDVGATD